MTTKPADNLSQKRKQLQQQITYIFQNPQLTFAQREKIVEELEKTVAKIEKLA